MHTRTPPVVSLLTDVFGALYAGLGSLAAASVLSQLPEAVTLSLAVAIAVVGAVQIGLRTYAARTSTATADVVEVLDPSDGEDVLAGPANSRVATGERVRGV